MKEKPNIVIIMTDQQRADICAREGFPLDTTPFLDSLAKNGTWFNRAYTSMPICVPARVSLFTGRYPGAHCVRTNHNLLDVYYEKDLLDVLKEHGYITAISGKNHSHVKRERFDYAFEMSHWGGSPENEAETQFDEYLKKASQNAHTEPTPFPLECQGPYRSVSHAVQWIRQVKEQKPFFLWLSFAEPHNPYQVCEPYFSLFKPGSLPPARSDASVLPGKGFKWEWNKQAFERAFPHFDEALPRARADYMGMLRLIDDQVKRFVNFLEQEHILENTIIVFLSDHGDYVGEYGLMRKGIELPECLARIPLFFTGPGIVSNPQPRGDHVSIVDIMPTLCDMLGIPLPPGVQGRSLWPMITGETYPAEEFSSAYVEQGFGGLHYTANDTLDPVAEGALTPGAKLDCLNSWSQSGHMRMVRKGDFKLTMDMQAHGQLYDLSKDPAELHNVYGGKEYRDTERDLLAELAAWMLRTQDPLPLPRRRYVMKKDPRNYWSPYQ